MASFWQMVWEQDVHLLVLFSSIDVQVTQNPCTLSKISNISTITNSHFLGVPSILARDERLFHFLRERQPQAKGGHAGRAGHADLEGLQTVSGGNFRVCNVGNMTGDLLIFSSITRALPTTLRHQHPGRCGCFTAPAGLSSVLHCPLSLTWSRLLKRSTRLLEGQL